VLDQLGQRGLLDWSRAAVDSVSVRAKRKAELTGSNHTDRGKAGTKYYVLYDHDGLPLHVLATGANAHDTQGWPPTPASGNAKARAGRAGVRASSTPISPGHSRGAA
jgi:hypothetical protein